jgi:hypothetical protein
MIRKWLQNQDDYNLQKPVRRNFKRAKVIVSGPTEQLDVDLADMQSSTNLFGSESKPPVGMDLYIHLLLIPLDWS